MKKLLLSIFCVLAFTGSSFAEELTLSGKSAELAKSAILSYYNGATWTNSGITYVAKASDQYPDKFSIIKRTTETVQRPTTYEGRVLVSGKERSGGRISVTETSDSPLCNVSVEDFLNYVADGTYPVSNK